MPAFNLLALQALIADRAPDPGVDMWDAFALITPEQWSDNLATRVITGLTKTYPVLPLPPSVELLAEYEDQIEVRRQDPDGNGPVLFILLFPDAPARLELPRLVTALAAALIEIIALP